MAIPSCLGSGHPDRLAAWLGLVGDWRIANDRWLSLAAWLGLMTGDQDRMTRWLLRAEAHASSDWEARVVSDEYAASLAALHTVVGIGGLSRTYRLGVATAQGLPPDSPFRTPALFLAGVSAALGRNAEEGRYLVTEAERLARALGVHTVEANALSWLAVTAGLEGDWETAGRLVDRAAVIIDEAFLDRLATAAHALTAQALLQAVRGRRTQARATLAKGSPDVRIDEGNHTLVCRLRPPVAGPHRFAPR